MVEEKLSYDGDESREQLDRAFRRFEDTQPALAARLGETLSEPLDETALALGYFLTLSIWLAFEATFGKDVNEITSTELEGVEQALQLDEELRVADPAEAVDSDDVIAMEQPDIVEFVHEHLDAALESSTEDVDVEDVHNIYRTVLIEVLALSYAVRSPSNVRLESTEMSA